VGVYIWIPRPQKSSCNYVRALFSWLVQELRRAVPILDIS
jgi:hypothetical protein